MYHARLCATQNPYAKFLQTLLQPISQSVYTLELREIVCQGISGGCGQHAGLSHATAKELPQPPGFLDELLRANQT